MTERVEWDYGIDVQGREAEGQVHTTWKLATLGYPPTLAFRHARRQGSTKLVLPGNRLSRSPLSRLSLPTFPSVSEPMQVRAGNLTMNASSRWWQDYNINCFNSFITI